MKSEILTDQMKLDITAERRRLVLLKECFTLLCTSAISKTADGDDDRKIVEDLKQTCETSLEKLSEEDFQTKFKMLQSVKERQGVSLTEEEKSEILSAMNAKPGSWYKCPEGHYYNIGDCGGAMEIGKCPECGSQIGGERHKLLETNQHAKEFDGSKLAAWPIGDDMRNYADL